MKKLATLSLFVLVTSSLFAQTLSSALPLLQKNKRTAAETQQVIQLLRNSKDPNIIFAAGASLVRVPPSQKQEHSLMDIMVMYNQPLKNLMAAIVLTTMGVRYEELFPILAGGLQSQDIAIKSYSAGASGLLNPSNTTYSDDIVRLYIFDPQFAQRALHSIAKEGNAQFKLLKKASISKDAQIRSAAATWLGTLHTKKANQQLLKMAKTEKESTVQTQLAIALAKNQAETLEQTVKGLKQNYQNIPSTTYALALGFMTGNAIPSLRQSLVSKNKNERINTLRALAYMANVLSNPDAFSYSNDRAFDTGLLKSFIPQLSLLSKTGDEEERTYTDNALRQFEKLM